MIVVFQISGYGRWPGGQIVVRQPGAPASPVNGFAAYAVRGPHKAVISSPWHPPDNLPRQPIVAGRIHRIRHVQSNVRQILKVLCDKEEAGLEKERTLYLRVPEELVGAIGAKHPAADNHSVEIRIGRGFIPGVANVSRDGVDAERSLLIIDPVNRRSD